MGFRERLLTPAAICCSLALLFGGCGAYCGVADPFFTSEGVGSGISGLAALGGLGVCFFLVLVSLLLIRQIVLPLVLVNLAVVVIAILFLPSGNYIVVGKTIPDFISRTRWGTSLAILAVSVLMSVPIYMLLSRWRDGVIRRGRRGI
jgi:hypothetical protein